MTKTKLTIKKLRLYLEDVYIEMKKCENENIKEYAEEFLRRNKKEIVNQFKKLANNIYLYNLNVRLSDLLVILKDGFIITFNVICVIDKEIRKLMILPKSWELAVPMRYVEFIKHYFGFKGYVMSKKTITIDIDSELRNKIMLELVFSEK